MAARIEPAVGSLYDEDFYVRARSQAAPLRDRRFDEPTRGGAVSRR